MIRLNAQHLVASLSKIKPVMEITKKGQNVLIRVSENEMRVCYSDGQHAIIDKIDVMSTEQGEMEKMEFVADYAKLNAVLGNCTSSTSIGVEPIEISLDSNNIMTISATKFISASGTDMDGRVVSRMNHKMQVFDVKSNIQFGVMTRMNYDSLFDIESYDEWSRAELKDIMSRLCSDEKEIVMYFSTLDNNAKAKNLNHGSIIKAPSCQTNGFSIRTLTANAMLEVVSRIGGDKVKISTDNQRFASFISENDKCAVWFEMANPNTIDKRAFEMYASVKVDDIMMKIHRTGFIGGIEAVMSTSNADKNIIKIVQTENGYALNVSSASAGGSVLSEVNVEIDQIKIADGINPLSYKAVMLVKEFKRILEKCRYGWVIFDVNMAQNRFVKVVDVEEQTEATARTYVEKASYFANLEEN